jgi:hypothetical protein
MTMMARELAERDSRHGGHAPCGQSRVGEDREPAPIARYPFGFTKIAPIRVGLAIYVGRLAEVNADRYRLAQSAKEGR